MNIIQTARDLAPTIRACIPELESKRTLPT